MTSSKAYAEGEAVREVLTGAQLSLHRGEFVVLLGRSGSGKSTLLNLISGIDLPTRGTVRVEGRELSRLSERERTLLRRERIGFIFQAFNLLPTLTVEENVRLPLELDRAHGAAADARVRELLGQVGLGDRARQLPGPALGRRAAARGGGPGAGALPRPCCWRTSPPATSTSRRAGRCWTCWRASPPGRTPARSS